MPKRDIIVIGTSAGGVNTLQQLVAGLPHDLPAAIFIVLHIAPNAVSYLPEILNRAGPLMAEHPHQGQQIEHGRIYIAPPNHHLMLQEPGIITLSSSARENLHRPAVDPLFRTAARTYGRRTIGVVLTGALDDGTAGLLAIKLRQGTAIVQDPADAHFSDMPRSAIQHVPNVDYVAPLTAIPQLLVSLVKQEIGSMVTSDDNRMHNGHSDGSGGGLDGGPDMPPEKRTSASEPGMTSETLRAGKASGYVCPECGGSLWEIDENGFRSYHCHTGHRLSANTLLMAQSVAVEEALWNAFRSLQEKVALMESMAERMRKNPSLQHLADDYVARATATKHHATVVHELLQTSNASSQEPAAD